MKGETSMFDYNRICDNFKKVQTIANQVAERQDELSDKFFQMEQNNAPQSELDALDREIIAIGKDWDMLDEVVEILRTFIGNMEDYEDGIEDEPIQAILQKYNINLD